MKKYLYRVSVDARFRGYTYTAHMTASGKVAAITAGCRTWSSFEHAIEHYDGGGPYSATKYTDQHITFEADRRGFWQGARLYAVRKDARRVLELLAEKVEQTQLFIARKRKKVKRAQKPAVRRRKR